MSEGQYQVTERTRLDRVSKRGAYDRETIYGVLDEALICHVGVAVDGQPYVLPMAYGRDGDRIFLHGSVASRLARHLAGGAPVCVTVTLLDGLVLARSGFSSSMNYRSVVILGSPRPVTDPDEKARALDVIADHLAPGRSREQRAPKPKELAATQVLELPLAEVSAKARTGPPEDVATDVGLPVWAGVLPLRRAPGAPEPAPDLPAGVDLPPSLSPWRRPSDS